tara:strand:- start:8793 stop:8939 length:147 start_codon:yes stop_codon:yes gene_type:complete
MKKKIKRRIKGTANAIFIGSAACMCIYGTLVLGAAKSILKMQTTRVDM